MSWGNLAGFSRQTGKTTAMLKAAKELGSVLLVRTHSEVQRLRNSGVTVKAATEGYEAFIGIKTPVLIDPDAFSFICSAMEHEHAEQIRRLKSAQDIHLRSLQQNHQREIESLDLRLVHSGKAYAALKEKIREVVGGG